MTIASSNLSKIGLGVPKENKNPIPTPAHFEKRNRLQYIKKKTLRFRLQPEHATPTFNSDSTTLA